MSVRIKELIKILQTKDPNQPVEAIIVGTDDTIQVLVLQQSANNFDAILKLFKKPKG
jgi:hypothetical protein